MIKTVLLAGASGYIGAHVADELLAHDYRLVCPVRAASRQGLSERAGFSTHLASGQLTLVDGNIDDPRSLHSVLAGEEIDAIISCIASRTGGIADSQRVDYDANKILLDWATDTGVEHFTLLSAICVQKPRLAFQHAKLRFERELSTSGLAHSIVRPTAFFKSLSGQVERVRRGQPFLVFGAGELTRCKPIAERELATYLRLTLEDVALRGILPIGGPGPALSPMDQARMLCELCDLPLRTRSVPPGLLLIASRVLDLPGSLIPRLADKAEFARIGHYYATESMLLWNEDMQRYDEEATPEFGMVTLQDSYRAQLAGQETQALKDQAVFK